MTSTPIFKPLGELLKGESGTIVSMNELTESSREVTRRLREMGILEGAPVTVVHEAPFGKDPIAIHSRGAIVALRRTEASLIQVEVKRK